MHNPEFVQENKTHKLFWDYELQTDHLIPARQPDLVIVNKKDNRPNSELCRPSRPPSENKRKQKER